MSTGKNDKMSGIVIQLAGLPMGKGRPRFVRKTGMVYTPAETRNYEAMLRALAVGAMRGKPPMTGPVRVGVHAFFPIPLSWSGKKQLAALEGRILPTTKPDVDNIIKMLDALNGIVFVDDKQIVRCRVTKTYCSRPRLTIEVSDMEAEK